MASESSSAVLELNDADADDTEATTVTEDTHEGTPLIMEHGYDIAIKVDSPMKQLSTLETFVTYRVRCVCARWPTPPHVRRRYNHFKTLCSVRGRGAHKSDKSRENLLLSDMCEVLHKRLSQSHPMLATPPLPPLHSARQQLDRYSPSFVAIRTMALDAFLDRVAKHPILTHSSDLRIFLTTPDEELEKVFKSDSSAMNLWGLSTALYGSGEAKATNGARVKDPEFSAVSEYLQSLQLKLNTLCSLTAKLHKGTAAVASQLMNLRRACGAWSPWAGGRCGVAAGAVGAGAGASACPPPAAPRRAPIAAIAPLLAAYASAHVDKIKQRDALHAMHVSGANATDELHNRLEQASEALRSDLSDWMPKTHADIKSLLLDLAESQVALHTQALLGWEHALKLSTDVNPGDIFKTVSKTAVQNLSPSRCRSVNETERDIDEISEEFDVSNDFEGDDAARLKNGDVKTDSGDVGSDLGDVKSEVGDVKSDSSEVRSEVVGFEIGVDDAKSISGHDKNYTGDVGLDHSDVRINDNTNVPDAKDATEDISSVIDESNIKITSESSESDKIRADNRVIDSDPLVNTDMESVSGNKNGIKGVNSDDFLKEILQDGARETGDNRDATDVIMDPLRGFSDVDLS